VVVAPFNFLGLAAPDLRRRAGLLGVSKAKGVTSEGESAVLEGLRVVATGRAALLSAGCASTGLAADLVVDLLVDWKLTGQLLWRLFCWFPRLLA